MNFKFNERIELGVNKVGGDVNATTSFESALNAPTSHYIKGMITSNLKNGFQVKRIDISKDSTCVCRWL